MRGWLVLWALTAGAPAFGARIVGNGGVGVVCSAGNEQTWEVLDFYEARHTDWQMPPDLGASTLGYLAKAGLALDRLAAADPQRAAQYRQWLAAFPDESFIFNDNHHFELINDYGSPLLQSNCHTAQIAVQRQPEVPEDRRYLIDGSLWGKLSEDDKAGLVLHELIFRDALARGQTDSVAAHYFTALYAWGQFAARVDTAELKKRLRRFNMDVYTYRGSTDGHTRMFYFLDDGSKTFAEALAACRALNLDTVLASDRDLRQNHYDLGFTSIGTKLLAPDGGTELWQGDAAGKYWVRFSREGVVSHDAGGERAAYLCAGAH